MQSNQSKVIEKVRSRLIPYCSIQYPQFKAPEHIRQIASALEAIESGEISRLIITVPPRHGKSMLISQFFPAWYLGRNPDKYIIAATYGQDLANDFGGKVRDQMIDPVYHQIFPKAKLKDDSAAKARFGTISGGEYYGVGAGGAVTGRGAHLLLIDDPIKNREEADSRVIREKIKEWYTSTAYTRLMPGGAVALIMTRWHEDDLVGFVQAEHTHENWKVINLPALQGETPLWPQQYSYNDILRIKETMSPYDWACLYQQDPIPSEGMIFDPEWIKSGLVGDDDYAAKYMAIDPAISKSTTADETAFTVFGVGYGKVPTYYELETVHGRFDFQEIINQGKELNKKHNLDMFGVESVAFQKALADEFTRQGLPCIELKADQDKVRRAMSVSHFFSQGRVRINTPALRNQLLRFRGVDGDADDMVDACVHCLRLIRDFSSAISEKPQNRYKGLDARSRQFWMNHFGDNPLQKKNSSDINKILGF